MKSRLISVTEITQLNFRRVRFRGAMILNSVLFDSMAVFRAETFMAVGVEDNVLISVISLRDCTSSSRARADLYIHTPTHTLSCKPFK